MKFLLPKGVLAALVTTLLLLSLSTSERAAGHDPVDFYGNNSWTLFRLPWQHHTSNGLTQGQNTSDNHNQTWNRFSLDFSMAIGTPLLAITDGSYCKAGSPLSPNGLGFWIVGLAPAAPGRSGTDYYFYGHLSATALDPGSDSDLNVNCLNGDYSDKWQGQAIGFSGNSGVSTGPHLHITVQNPGDIAYSSGTSVDFPPLSGVSDWTHYDIPPPHQYHSDSVLAGDDNTLPTPAFTQAIFDAWYDYGGLTYVGSTYNANGSGPGVHSWGNGLVQDVIGPDHGHGTGAGALMLKNGASEAFWVHGDIWDKHVAEGGPVGWLGYPTLYELEPCLPPPSFPSGCLRYQKFEGGCVWIDNTGSHANHCLGVYAVTEDSTPDYARLSIGTWVSKGVAPGGSHDLEYYGNGLLLNVPPVSPGGQFRRSTDSGETWTTLSTPDSSRRPVDTARSPSGRLWMLMSKPATGTWEVFFSDTNGNSWVLATEFTASTGGQYGSIAAHPTDSSRVAVAWQTGANTTMVAVNILGNQSPTPGAFTTHLMTNAAGSAPQIIWAGATRLVLVGDRASSFRLQYSDNDGQTWSASNPSSFSTTSVYTLTEGVITKAGDLSVLFTFCESSDSSPRHVLARSTDAGSTWTNISALPSGTLTTPQAIAYDPGDDSLYVAWWASSRVTKLPNASTRDWGAVTAGDWIAVAASPGRTGVRGLVVLGN